MRSTYLSRVIPVEGDDYLLPLRQLRLDFLRYGAHIGLIEETLDTDGCIRESCERAGRLGWVMHSAYRLVFRPFVLSIQDIREEYGESTSCGCHARTKIRYGEMDITLETRPASSRSRGIRNSPHGGAELVLSVDGEESMRRLERIIIDYSFIRIR